MLDLGFADLTSWSEGRIAEARRLVVAKTLPSIWQRDTRCSWLRWTAARLGHALVSLGCQFERYAGNGVALDAWRVR